MPKKQEYSLKQVKEVYSYWGKSLIAYKSGISFFGFGTCIRRKAVEELKLKKGSSVLDLACGPGVMFKLLEEKIGTKGRLIAVDYVDEMTKQCLKLAKKKKWDNIEIIKADAAKMKIKKNSLNGIISVISLSAIPDHKKALLNCYSALKKGGRLVVLDGKDFGQRFKLLNPLLNILRWPKSYEKKDLIADIKKAFGNISVKEYLLGSTFIAVAVKK